MMYVSTGRRKDDGFGGVFWFVCFFGACRSMNARIGVNNLELILALFSRRWHSASTNAMFEFHG